MGGRRASRAPAYRIGRSRRPDRGPRCGPCPVPRGAGMTPDFSSLLALVPGDAEIVQPLIALGIALLLHLAATAAARVVAPRLREKAAILSEALAGRLRAMLRYALSALFIGFATALWPVDTAPHLVLGIALGLSVTLLAAHCLRALAIPVWAVAPLALLLFLTTLSGTNGGLTPVGPMLDAIGIGRGQRRVALVGLTAMAALCGALVAIGRRGNRPLWGII